MPSPPPPKPKKEIGVDYMSSPTAYAYVGDKRWPIKRTALTKSVMDAVTKAVAGYEEAIRKLAADADPSDIKRLAVYDAAGRAILEAALDGFDYDREAEDPDVGPSQLGLLGTEVKDFLIVGGARGARHVQQRLATMNGR